MAIFSSVGGLAVPHEHLGEMTAMSRWHGIGALPERSTECSPEISIGPPRGGIEPYVRRTGGIELYVRRTGK